MARPHLTQVQVDDFRTRVCEAALEMIAERGVARLTLRALARRLGCSYAKPYRYFRNKEGLLDAVRGHAFDRLGAFMRGEGEAASIPLLDRYLRFAFDHPEAYRVMFELDPTDCTGCKRCDIVCPSGAISVTEKRAAIDRTVGRTFDDFGIEHDLFERWGESGDPELRELK